MAAPATLPQPNGQAAAQAPQAPAPAPVQAPAPAAPPIPMEDRQLTPEETESLLRGLQPEVQHPEVPDQHEQAQEQMAADFFSPNAPRTPVPTPTPDARAAAVQQTLDPQQAGVAQPVQAPAPMPAPVPVETPEVAALRAQNMLLQQQIMQYQQRPPTPAPAPQQAPPTQAPAQYGFNVPDEYLHALADENIQVRRQAMNGLLNGVAAVVSQNIRSEMEQRVAAIPQSIAPVVDERLRGSEIQRDMYGTYPELAPFRQYVQAAAMQVAGTLGTEAWNSDVRDMIAERVAPMVPGLMQRVQQNRAQRQQMQAPQPVQYQVPYQSAPMPAPLPQGGQGVPAPYGVPQAPVQHGGSVMYVRDATGALVPYAPQQQFVHGQQTRPAGPALSPQVQDIQATLGFL